jgi:hypothetical protein
MCCWCRGSENKCAYEGCTYTHTHTHTYTSKHVSVDMVILLGTFKNISPFFRSVSAMTPVPYGVVKSDVV